MSKEILGTRLPLPEVKALPSSARSVPDFLPIRSMTGYASVRRETSAGELTVSLRTVNHRGLDLHFYHAQEFAPFENGMRAVLKEQISRAHVEIRIGLERNADSETGSYRAGVLGQYLAAFQQAKEEFGLASQPDLNVLFTLPGVMMMAEKRGAEPLPAAFGEPLLAALRECAAELNTVREREGEALRRELETQADEIEARTEEIVRTRAEALPFFQARLRERVSELLAGSHVTEARVVEEAAILADRSDIQEELTRLQVHAKELRRILEGGGEVGKRLDFLLQEINRETNTALAKSASAGEPGLRITNTGLGLKANIERVREQALNLE